MIGIRRHLAEVCAPAIRRLKFFLRRKVYAGRSPAAVPPGSIVLFPCDDTRLCCGLAGLVAVAEPVATAPAAAPAVVEAAVRGVENRGLAVCEGDGAGLAGRYLGGEAHLKSLFTAVRRWKTTAPFMETLLNPSRLTLLKTLADRIKAVVTVEEGLLPQHIGRLNVEDADIMTRSLEVLKDVHWCLKTEIGDNIDKTTELIHLPVVYENPSALKLFREINAVLNSIDRLEVKGRDSAGISLLLFYGNTEYLEFKRRLDEDSLMKNLESRATRDILTNRAISIRPDSGGDATAVVFTFKVAAEIGCLGDNIAFIRDQIRSDPVFQRAVTVPMRSYTISSHTRWASVGAITEANCHPVDNTTGAPEPAACGIIHTCLNGDIDNYLTLRQSLMEEGVFIPEGITTDTKIIPLQIEKYIRRGVDVTEAFRLAVNDFSGSHAISMHTDLAPGRLFLAQKGSGQAIFVGLAADHYMPASEVYGFIEETSDYLKLDGEKIVPGKNGSTQGQIVVLDQRAAGGIDGIEAMYYDGTPIALGPSDIKHTEITSRDIDRQLYPHYFLKEISEAPLSVERTLRNRWKMKADRSDQYVTTLDESVIPRRLATAIAEKTIRRIFFIGQGTAGVAAQACAGILSHYMNDKALMIDALKASEMSGSRMSEGDGPDSMTDTLVIAISQSGTTTDTNRTVDMVRERGAATLAIVNRRDSDLTFKVDGVLYTSSGRDIEMSVASTKAFYSQIVAGTLLGLHLASITGRRDAEFITAEIRSLLELPRHMRQVLGMQESIKASARRLAGRKTHWAAVGSGLNKTSADEIRIKLSELCYKTISSDFVEDKKHIDLSSEPLIIVCAAGTRRTVIGDIKKDTAIFKAHKAATVVIADSGETGFDNYADDVFPVPTVAEHLAPILNTLVGHIWGYYAALAINEGSRFLHGFREELKAFVNTRAAEGLDVYEVVLEKTFREKIALFYRTLRSKRREKGFPVAIARASDLILLLKYLSGRLPVSDFEIDFGIKGTALNMLNMLFETIGEAINAMSRPIDAIKHQAKTVTVGTSRITEKVEGILFDALTAHGLDIDRLINKNVIVLKNLQAVVERIQGSILYEIGGLNLLGEPTEETTIRVLHKAGVLKPIPSRVETDPHLKGTKRIIVQNGNVYIGKGRKDGRSILVIPVMSASSTAPNVIEHLLLVNIAFRPQVPLDAKIKALGGKYEHIKNIVQENSLAWDDTHLDRVGMEELFGRSAEKISEFIISDISPADQKERPERRV